MCKYVYKYKYIYIFYMVFFIFFAFWVCRRRLKPCLCVTALGRGGRRGLKRDFHVTHDDDDNGDAGKEAF